ncbi:gustatory receptor for sugar taste 64f-like [Culicoides brevitarsis]|uniref:gustatory receptor for sugar taste 64f-like n=1 Tax=Culicoides brevitarsis TaxID=469753 RepID=UPI00307B63A6
MEYKSKIKQKTSSCCAYFSIFNKRFQGIFDSNYFFDATAPVFAFALSFGAMPMYGILSGDPYKLTFRWKSFRFFWSVLLILSQIMFTVTVINNSIQKGLTILKMTLVVVYNSVTYIMFQMLFIARKWPETMRFWRKVELSLPPMQDAVRSKSMGRRIRKFAPTVTFLSLTEHTLGLIATGVSIVKCPIDPDDYVKSFFIEHLPVFFDDTTYEPWKAFLAKFANLVNTFMWFYVDLFIMLVAMGLSSVFKQYCDFLVKFSGKRVTKQFWDEQRAAYRQVCELIEYVDRVISPITIVSFSNNLYFICLQLMNSLNERRSQVHSVYFWYTLIYLICRTSAVCLLSAEINEQSKRPLLLFRNVPMESWCAESKRFLEDVTETVCALSGMRFFYLTRKLLLSVAGTIVTYELVILQFYDRGSGSGIRVCNTTFTNITTT